MLAPKLLNMLSHPILNILKETIRHTCTQNNVSPLSLLYYFLRPPRSFNCSWITVP